MRDNYREIYTFGPNVSVFFAPDTAIVEDVATARLSLTPKTTAEVVCRFRIDVEGIAANKWRGATMSGFVVYDPSRHYVGVISDQPKEDPC